MGGYTWHDNGERPSTEVAPAATTPEEARERLGQQFANAADYCRENGYGALRLERLAGYQQLKEKENQ